MQNVLDSMVTALLEDKNRKFIYVEQVKIEYYIGLREFAFILSSCLFAQQSVVDNRIST